MLVGTRKANEKVISLTKPSLGDYIIVQDEKTNFRTLEIVRSVIGSYDGNDWSLCSSLPITKEEIIQGQKLLKPYLEEVSELCKENSDFEQKQLALKSKGESKGYINRSIKRFIINSVLLVCLLIALNGLFQTLSSNHSLIAESYRGTWYFLVSVLTSVFK